MELMDGMKTNLFMTFKYVCRPESSAKPLIVNLSGPLGELAFMTLNN